MYGMGILKTFSVTVGRFVTTYVDDLKWFLKAAEQGEPRAQDMVAKFYRAGVVVGRDDEAAADWYRKAADQGYADAQFKLGDIFPPGAGEISAFSLISNCFRKP